MTTTLDQYRGTQIEKCYVSSNKEDFTDPKKVFDTLNSNLKKGLISEELHEKALIQLDNLIEKAQGKKYIKRTGIPGSYKYYYTEEDYKVGVKDGEVKPEDIKINDKKVTNIAYLSNLLNKEDAKISTFINNSGDKIVKVNGETAFNLSDKGMTSNEDRKSAMERAYKASKETVTPKHISDMSKEEKHSMAEKMGISGHKEMTEKELNKQLIDKKIDEILDSRKEDDKEDKNLKKSFEENINILKSK